MAKICTKEVNLDQNVVIFKFANGETITAKMNDLPSHIVHTLALHGLSQKLGDSYASAVSVDEAIQRFTETLRNLENGSWAVRVSTGGKLAEALARVTGKDMEAVMALLNAMKEEEKKTLSKHPDIKLALAEIEAERLARNAKGSGTKDLAALFGELPGMLKDQAV